MKKEMDDLPPEAQSQIRELERLPDELIDTSDIPEVLDWSGSQRGLFFRSREMEVRLTLDAEGVNQLAIAS